jgi:hypothetical protein
MVQSYQLSQLAEIKIRIVVMSETILAHVAPSWAMAWPTASRQHADQRFHDPRWARLHRHCS